MSFLAPAFLAGLLALAIPVLIHLIQREKKNIVHFPSLMFVRKIPYQSIRRRRIHHWLLLLIRAAAIAVIIAAFSRPFFTNPAGAASGLTGAREVVILLDRSYSMGYGDRWTRAQAAARDVVQNLGPDDRASLVVFAKAAQADARSSNERERVLAAIDSAKVGSGATKYGPALKLAQSILTQSQLPRREAVLITDFQRAGWEGAEGIRFPDGTVVTPVAISDATTQNLAVASASFQRAYFSGQERITLAAALTNRGAEAVPQTDVTLEIDGRQVQSQRATIAAQGSASVQFAPFTLTEPYTRGTIKLGPDALPQDNVFHFVLSPAAPLSVLIVERAGAGRDSSLYLSRALGIGTAPSYDVDVLPVERLTEADLRDRSLVILNDVAPPRGGVLNRIRGLVEGGGGLWILAGDRAAWSSADSGNLLPGSFGPSVDRSSGGGATLNTIDYSHPVFELFKKPRSGDFSTARFFRYRSLAPVAGSTVLARFDDGGAALVEQAIGRGRVVVWTSTLDSVSNDLPLRPVFLPFVHRVARHLTHYTEPSPWLTVEQVLENTETGAGVTAVSPSGQRIPVGPGGNAENGAIFELTEQGFYEIRKPAERESRPITVAANLDPAESDLTAMDAQELVSAVTGRAGTAGAAVAGNLDLAESKPEDEERQQSLWWYLLLAGVVGLAVETAISNRLSKAAPGS